MESCYKSDNGFTLVEVLVTLAVSLVLLGAVWGFFENQHRNYSTQERLTEMQQNARAGLEMMSREIRMAGYNPTGAVGLPVCAGTNMASASNSPCAGISNASSNTVSFSADLNGNGAVTPATASANPGENISYSIYTCGNHQCLGRTSNGSLQPLADHITGLTLTYYDSSDGIASDLSLIRKVKISLVAATSAPDFKNVTRTMTLTADVTLRNYD
ncbi:MAG: prepilin-type N-terminal cleavage/methylation domain-containing protein [Syntrophus sp. (in: bacteria)]|nr:prepilin-type N-terminal cleavage/methylation domain-containing protein [Syntrophus sp. (in: bacteria)]